MFCIVNIFCIEFFGFWSEEKWANSKGYVSFVEVNQGIERYSVMQLLILEENWSLLSVSVSVSFFYAYTHSNTNRWGFKDLYEGSKKIINLQVEKKMDLVYGGGGFGLMGLVSQTVFDGGCHVLG